MKNKEPNLNRDREFTVILEGLRSDFKALAKELFALIEKVDTLSNKVNSIFEMTGRNTEDIHSIKTDFKTFDKRIALLEKTVFNS